MQSYAPSSSRAAGAKEGEIGGSGRTERPGDEAFERFRNLGRQMPLLYSLADLRLLLCQ